jgi:hypothetical protein
MAKLKNKEIIKQEKKEILTEGPLGGKILEARDFKTGEMTPLPDDGRDYQAEIEKTRALGIPDIQKVEIRNPITNKKEIITIDRTGTTDAKLGALLLSPQANQEQKDSLLSLYLFERGKESASFLAELFASKGQHTTETRAFKTQMRRDYEVIVDTLSSFMQLSAESIISAIDPEANLEDLEEEALGFLKKNKKATLVQFAATKYPTDKSLAALFLLSIRFHSESALLLEKVEEVLESRLKESKYGLYISPSGKVFDTKSPTFMEDIANDIRQQKVEAETKEKENGKENKE